MGKRNNAKKTATRVRKATAPKQPKQAARAPTANRSAHQEAPARQQENKLVQKVNGEDAALVNFLDSLTNPNALPSRVPLLLGEFSLETDTYQVEYSGVASAGTLGATFIAVAPDNWLTTVNDGTPSDQMVAANGGTQGYTVWYGIKNAGTGTLSTPTRGAASGGNSVGKAGVSLGPGITSTTRMRVTALNLEIWSDAAGQTAQGDISVACVQGGGALADGALNGAQYGQLTAFKQDYVSHQEYPLAGWKAGQRVHTHLTQWDEQCFALENVPNNGTVTAPNFALACVAAGMADGQTISWKVTINYETTKYATYQTDLSAGRTPYLEPARVVNALRPLHGTRPTIGKEGHGAAKGLNAMVMANPDKAKALMSPGGGNPTFTDNLTKTAKQGLGFLASKIPYVGGLAKSAIDWLFD